MTTNFEDTGATLRSAEECENIARVLRRALGCTGDDRLPDISKALENARKNIPQMRDLELVVRGDHSMGRSEAAANTKAREIEIRESDLDGVFQDTPRMRSLILHELAHLLLHTGQDKFFRISEGNVLYHSFLHGDETRAEWQANRVMRAILMPPEMVARAANARELAEISRSPFSEAIARIQDLTPTKGHSVSHQILAAISELKLNAASNPAEHARIEAETLKLKLWSKLPTLPGEDKRKVRLCGKYQILWNEFGKTTGCGWFIEDGKIRAHYERYD